MTYLTLTTYCWMLCEGIHIFICLEHPLQVKTMVICMYLIWGSLPLGKISFYAQNS